MYDCPQKSCPTLFNTKSSPAVKYLLKINHTLRTEASCLEQRSGKFKKITTFFASRIK
jgi:hypothetical protein